MEILKKIGRVIIRFVILTYCRIVYRLKVVGLENVPKDGAVIFCGNHRTYLDPPLIVVTAGRDMRFMAKEELSELTVLADKFAGTYRFIGDTVLFNQYTGLNDIFQIEIPKLKLDSSYSMSLNASTEAVVFSFKGKALRDDLGNMIIFRQLKQDSKSGDSGEKQLDGSYRGIPAVEVTIDGETGNIITNDISA